MPSVEIPLNTASRPQLQRLNSREILRSLPSEHDALSTSVKRERVRRDAQPVLNTMRRVSAPPLAPKVLEPLRRSKASDATSRLQQIERIQVGHATRKADGHVYYSIDVYTSHNASHIPTNQPRDRRILHARKHPSAPTTSEPDFRIERRFSDFEQLRHTVLDSVQHSHRHYCNFCEGYSMLLLFSTAQPTVITRTLVHSTQSRARLLSKFLNHVLIEFQMNRPRCQFPCHGGAMVPLILHDFLFLGEDDIEDSRSSTSDADSVASSPVAWLRDSEVSPVAFLSR